MWQKSLLEYVDIYPQTTPALDAFDECDREERGTLLQILDDLIKPSLKPVEISYLVDQIETSGIDSKAEQTSKYLQETMMPT